MPIRPLVRTLTLPLAAAALSALLAGCSAKGETEASAAQTAAAEQPSLPVTRLVTRDTVLFRKYVADIQALRNVELRGRVAGFLEHIHVDEGQPVKAGQLLFSINDAPFRTQITRAQAALSSAQADTRVAELEVKQVTMLVAKNIVSDTELEVAKAKLKAAQSHVAQAQSALASARLNLSYTQVRAPFDGIIDRIPLKVGSLVDDGTLLTTVSDIRSVYAYFTVSEGEYLDYVKRHPKGVSSAESSDDVRLILADGSTYPQAGRIETVESEFDANTGSIAFRARFANPNHLLKHGATGRVQLSSAVDDALLLPQKAAFELQDKNYVFVVDQQNRLHQRHFVPRTRLAHFYLVESGLQPGERVVYEGVQDARDGMLIRPQTVGMDSLLAPAPPHTGGGGAGAVAHAH
ncbi:efflux RND transporter periplasmic adaptor subunit [Hymenobacter jeollabukensis]|uniref:Efflux RND transporter periplasmic adaptor subunit n=1 Tax=Hymenobacter jeollabukensis TaxID=2025313 RepID=A0A5R8WL72_9BACT|nr:efflux RND transporter periplasmic adaptor subunit [Hymenobacter jeollabukensis]TLM89427.1 efflux RND transporter periplasmic adaptor subunit [Hymenobacter jeollabukensis]